MRFRPCIDLHRGRVVQIVGSTLGAGDAPPSTNFSSEQPASHFAELYRRDRLDGGHLIMLGPGSEAAATEALGAWPGGLQVGGGMTPDNGRAWLERGAAGIIVTSYLFAEGRFHLDRLERLKESIGRERLILDLSCAPREGTYVVATNRWQQLTDFAIDQRNLEMLAQHCAEFLIHATQMEGKRGGIDAQLVRLLGEVSPIPTTYAGGIRDAEDIERIERLGAGRLDFTVGSALDIFGGSGVNYEDLVALNRSQASDTR